MNTVSMNTVLLDGGTIIKKGDGGGTTINNQNKTVEIVENGSLSVVADSGYTGLGEVAINVNVPTSGGSSGGDNTLNLRYFTHNEEVYLKEFSLFALLKKCINNDTLFISAADIGTLTAIAVDFNLKIFLYGGDLLSVNDYLASMGIEDGDSYLSSGGFVEITKEEFYAV